MNLEALRSRVRKLSGVQMTTLLSNADLDTIINEAYDTIMDLEDWSFLETTYSFATVAGTATHDLQTPLRHIDTIELDDGTVLQPRTAESLDREDPDPEQGEPKFYVHRDHDTIELWPTPDDAYTLHVRGWKTWDALAVGLSPTFDEVYHPAVAYLAAVAVLEEEGDDSGRSDDYRGKAVDLVSRMRHRYQRSHSRTLIVMGGRATSRAAGYGG